MDSDVPHRPREAGAQATTALLSGASGAMLANRQLVVSLAQSGTLRALAATGPTRMETLPCGATLKATGVSGVDITTWFGLRAPQGAPAAALERLNAAPRQALAGPGMKRQLEAHGDGAVGSSVADPTACVRAKHSHRVGFVQSASITLA